jgi:hypothetical protein
MSHKSNPVLLKEIEASTEKFHAVIGLIKHAFSVLGLIGSLYVTFSGLEPFFKSNPEAISAMAYFIEKLNFGNSFGYLASAIFGTGWALEHRGKKRAIAKKAEYQAKAEQGDSYRSSSGLTTTGNTPT